MTTTRGVGGQEGTHLVHHDVPIPVVGGNDPKGTPRHPIGHHSRHHRPPPGGSWLRRLRLPSALLLFFVLVFIEKNVILVELWAVVFVVLSVGCIVFKLPEKLVLTRMERFLKDLGTR